MTAETVLAAHLPPLDHRSRDVRLRARVSAGPWDALVLTSMTNIRWLTGFTGSNGWVVLSPGGTTLITDGRYGDQARQEVAAAATDVEVVVGSTRAQMTGVLAGLVSGERLGAVGFEAAHLSVADHGALTSSIEASWLATVDVVESLRRTKDAGEIARMEQAADIADAALADVVVRLSEEPTEADLRDELELAMRTHGADGPSFDTIVATGANAALPHHHPDRTRIVEGATVVIDFGALYDGYHSDMTRTFVLGQPSALQAEVYEVVLQAQRAGVAAVSAGAGGRALDAVCRDRIGAEGWGPWFTHGTGHGVGLQIHESPWLTQGYDDILADQDVVTVEPGVYRDDFGGVRIEDMVVVTTTGCRPLTKTPKDSPCPPSRRTT